MPQQFNTKMEYGCPYDCGLCPDHMQHSCLSVVEITDNCNLNCPVCYAESGTHRERHRPLEDVIRMLDAIVANEGEADVMQLSGGEPTLHPQFWEILDAAKARPIKHVMVNTNGIVLAQDKDVVARLAGYAPGIEVYLQFDSLRAEVHRELRGADLTRIRRQALDNLNAAGLSTTLVVTLKKGLNDGEIGEIIDFALGQPCVRGVTLQPIQDAGRVQDYDPRLHRLTVSEIRRRIAEQSRLFTLEDVVPVPCNPDTLAMAYAIKTEEGTVPLTRWLDPQTLVEGSGNTIVFERDAGMREVVKDQVFKLFSTNHSPESQANCLSELMCCLPLISAPSALRYDNVFRVLIVQFMDAYSLDVRALKKSCIHFALPDGRLVPFESYNLLYRDGRKLEQIRAGIASDFARRRERATIPLVPASPSA
jgi:uncharacterized radical SAM superfamily Fe-S cluster-containing enzyme